MPWQSLKLVPGLDTEQTPSLLEGRFTQASYVRWREGLVEKLGGWAPFYATPFSGTVRELHAWQNLNNVPQLGVGSDQGLSVIASGVNTSLTPQTYSSSVSPNFSTVINTTTVTIVDSNISNVTTWDVVVIQTPIAIGGLVLFGSYPIQSIVGATSYTITAATAATATVPNAGTVAALTTTISSAYVKVTLTAHGLVAGDTVNFPVSTTLGGLTISGNYTVTSIIDADNFNIAATTTATSNAGPTSMNSGNAKLLYQLGIGPSAGASGYGSGGWGTGGWGSGASANQQQGTPISATDWTIDNWGEDLIACPKGGGLYYWAPESGATTALPIPNAPPFNNGVMVAMPQLILVAWGSTAQLSLGVNQDPMLVSWSNAGDFTNWTISNATLAGDFRLSGGSQIVGGFQSSFRTLLLTDTQCWAMDYTGYPYTWSFNVVGKNCGLVGRGAITELSGAVFWMGASNFYVLQGGGTKPLPCSVYDAVFQDLDTANAYKARAGTNAAFNEVWFFYPSLSGGTGENDKYVKYNISENAWDYGSLSRSAWLGQSILGTPIAAGSDNVLYQHESGYNANNAALTPAWSTGYFALAEGEQFSFVDFFAPDMRFGTWLGSQNASVQFTFSSKEYVSDTPTTYGPYTANSSTEFIPLRIRGRFLSIAMSSSDSNTFWRMGRPRFRIAPAGRR